MYIYLKPEMHNRPICIMHFCLYNVVEGLSESEGMPVVKFLWCVQLNHKLFR